MTATTKKANIFQKMAKYLKEVKAELKKVVWPAFAKVRKDTSVVIVAILAVGLFIALLDLLFGGLLKSLLQLNGGGAEALAGFLTLC